MGAAEGMGGRRAAWGGLGGFRVKTGVLALALLSPVLRAATLSIENSTLRVTCDDATDTFSVARISDGKVFARAALNLLNPVKAVTRQIDADSATAVCEENVIDLSDSSGKDLLLGLDSRDLFTIRATIKNGANSEEIINQVPLVTFAPDITQPDAKLAIRGTGGLHAAREYAPRTHPWLHAIWDKISRNHYHPLGGSYEWLAVADPQTRAGIVAGFLTQNRATGVLVPKFDGDKLSVEARSEFGQLHLAPGQTVQTETLTLGYFDDVRLGLEGYAKQLALWHQVHLPPQPAGCTTWYMEKNGGAGDEQSLGTLSDFMAKNLKPYGMSFLQIDDRWQAGQDTGNGPDKNFTASNPRGPYPSGMKATADKIRADGLTAGLWFLPFSGDYKDSWFADKQAFFVKTKDGKPYDTGWGGTSLDMTNPAAQSYLKGIVSNIVHNWDFSYLKIDGLYTGLGAQNIYVSSGYNPADGFDNAVFANPTKTNVEAFRDGLKLIRTAAGPDTFILGCNTAQNMRVFGASMGLVDAMRIGPDNAQLLFTGDDGNLGPPHIAVDWKSWRDASPLYGSREYFLNGRVWYNDPDPNYVRSSLTLDEARTEASWTAISGQLFTSSDWLPDLPAERLDIIKRTVTPHGGTARPVDFLDNDPSRVWQLTDGTADARRDVIGLFNFDDTPQTITVPLDRLDLPKADSYAAFDFWADAFLPPIKDTISAALAPHACQIIAVRPMLDHPFVISTSRNITQGIVDLTNEKWEPATRRLSGISRVISGDPYELRIAAPGAAGAWTIKSCTTNLLVNGSVLFTSESGPKIVPSTSNELRATITAPIDAPAFWQITFN
jgi:hypothetical protein